MFVAFGYRDVGECANALQDFPDQYNRKYAIRLRTFGLKLRQYRCLQQNVILCFKIINDCFGISRSRSFQLSPRVPTLNSDCNSFLLSTIRMWPLRRPIFLHSPVSLELSTAEKSVFEIFGSIITSHALFLFLVYSCFQYPLICRKSTIHNSNEAKGVSEIQTLNFFYGFDCKQQKNRLPEIH